MRRDCIPNALSKVFYIYGKTVAKHPLPFLIAPFIITGGLLFGLIKMESSSDAEYLYAPVGSPSKSERDFFRSTFPSLDRNGFSPLRATERGGYLQVLIEDQHSKNILSKNVIQSIETLHEFIMTFRIKNKDTSFNYSSLCATWQDQCYVSGFIEILDDNVGIDIENISIVYPIHTTSTGKRLSLTRVLGDPTYDVEGKVTGIRSVLLSYFFRRQEPDDSEATLLFLDAIRDKLLTYSDPSINIFFETSQSLEQELEKAVSSILPLFVVAFATLTTFALLSSLMFDWVRAKPWVAISGIVAAILGVASALGFWSAVGLKFASIVGTMPFLMIGIGLDNMFILLSSWRYTSVFLTPEIRLAQTLQASAVSITITTVTDALAFGIGCLTPFRSVTIYCAYSGVAVIFVYFYMLTFTTACLYYSGRRESRNKHPFGCKIVPTKQEAGDRSLCFRAFCTGGHVKHEDLEVERSTSNDKANVSANGSSAKKQTKLDSHVSTDPEAGIYLPWLNQFLGTHFATWLLKIPSRISVVLVYLAMIGGAIYGILNLEEGLDRANLAPDSSYYRGFSDNLNRDFNENYGPAVMVAIDNHLDLTDAAVRRQIDELVRDFQSRRYFVDESDFVIFWLYNFETYLTASNRSIANFANMSEFIFVLRNEFLAVPAAEIYKLDINFSLDFEVITSTRFFIQSSALSSSTDEMNMMAAARGVAKESKFDVWVFSPLFIFYDQYELIAITVIQNLGIAVACIFVVSLVFIPSFVTVIWVTATTISICTCIIGYMALWDVNLDSVSTINLIMCIGFSVDFAAHISYHFVASNHGDSLHKAKEALGVLGTPIIQGAMSTVLAVLALCTSETYLFRTFFKLVFLVMLFGFFHAMFLLPVLLASLQCRKQCCKTPSRNNTTHPKTKPKLDSEVEGVTNAAFN